MDRQSPRNSISQGAIPSQPQQQPASYTPDEQAFHKLFPQVPLNEKLVESYQCGLSRKKIVRMGRLYLTSLRVCFHSTFMSEGIMLEWENVEHVEKKENFVFEAVVIKAATGESHYFSAFMYGMTDQAHKMITMLWSVRKKYASAGNLPPPPAGLPVANNRSIHPRTDSNASSGSLQGYSAARNLSPTAIDAKAHRDEATGGPRERRESPDHLAATAVCGDIVDVHQPAVSPAAVESPQVEPLTRTPENASLSQSPQLPPTKEPEAHEGRLLSPTASCGKPESSATPPNLSLPNGSLAAAVVCTQLEGSIPAAPEPSPPTVAAVESPSASSMMPPAPPPLVDVQPEPSVSVLPPAVASPVPLQRESNRSASPPPQMQQTPSTPLVPPRGDKKQLDKTAARASVAVESLTPAAPHDILRHFPTVPKTETVVDTFQCSYVVGVHRLGKLYITANYVLFSSVMLAEGVSVKFSEITAIEKEQTMVILDGVAITTKSGQLHSFTSFVNRDSAFSILQHFFQAHKSKQSTKDKLKEQKDKESKDKQQDKESTDISAAEAAASPNVDDTAAASPVSLDSVVKPSSPMVTKPSPKVSAPKKKKQVSTPGCGFLTQTCPPDFSRLPSVASIDEFSTVATDFGTGLSDVSNFLAKQLIPDVNFEEGYSIFDIFRYVFDDETSVLDTYHNNRQDTGLTWEPWRAPLSGPLVGFAGQRKMLCTTIIRAVMAKACPFTEFQRYAMMNVNGSPHLLFQVSGQATGVMFSDSFRAETLLVLSQPSPTVSRVTMKVFGYIQFLRSVWVRGKILSTALDVEMPECYRSLTTIVTQKLKSVPKNQIYGVTSVENDEESGDSEEQQVEAKATHPLPVAVAPPAPALVVAAPQAFPTQAPPPPTPQPSLPTGHMKTAHLVVYVISILYTVQGLWTAFWMNSATGVSGGMVLDAASLPASSGQPVVSVTLQLDWLINIVRPVAIIGLLSLLLALIQRVEGLLSAP